MLAEVIRLHSLTLELSYIYCTVKAEGIYFIYFFNTVFIDERWRRRIPVWFLNSQLYSPAHRCFYLKRLQFINNFYCQSASHTQHSANIGFTETKFIQSFYRFNRNKFNSVPSLWENDKVVLGPL